MADVFISYKRTDRAWAERISDALRDAGISSWWDTSLVGGEHFNEAIDRELTECRCVVVIWSEEAHASRWVQAEALRGFERGILVPARLDDVALGYPFSAVPTVDLRRDDIAGLIEGVQAKLGTPVATSRRRSGALIAASSVSCLLASIVLEVMAVLQSKVDEDSVFYMIEAIGGFVLGAIGAVALFQWISRRDSVTPLIGGSLAAAAAFVLTAVVGSWVDENTSLGTAVTLLLFTPAATAISAALAFLMRRLR